MKTFIYILIDPRNNQVRYVGQTINIEKRLKSHLRTNKTFNVRKEEWILSLINDGLKPEIFIIDTLENDIDFWEIHYISLYAYYGFDLLNITIGGNDIIHRDRRLKHRDKILKDKPKPIKVIKSTKELKYDKLHLDRQNELSLLNNFKSSIDDILSL